MTRPNDRLALAGRLRSARQSTGASLKTVAPAVGVDYTHLSKIETGAAVPSADLLNRLISFYQVADPDEVYVAAGILPPDVMRILQTAGSNAFDLLRSWYVGNP